MKFLLLILPDPLFADNLISSKLSLLFSQAMKDDRDVSCMILIAQVFLVWSRDCMMMLNRTYVSSLLDCKVGAKMEEGVGCVCPANHSAGLPLAPVTAFLPEN